ncbi:MULTISPECIES: DoxX family protein [Streptomyces]|uniref:Putative integral membrane protein n=1 Tax=Streptomyces scabiei (strain 87.22) TaxID=680198 RepID=C9ZE27_STRSW|nr:MULTISPECIES: DoxX family protein [Streptomyces]MBP5864010.1 DoxX family protein [Streptomyces sp. LBUM 1484]MBP5867031.1 DoxX family protein [Streptomyces sp. LBUM 1485]MBP5905641.1 DoxX family protein [Streptomyces sp. LBUM 1478]MBP5931873.1 DoxX family protein [Streptomyces sp. LBUM 1479]KFG08144.1 DoxX family protein [Streptomyces scabiei]
MTGRLNRAQPYVLGLFRIVIGLLFACHGAKSLFGVLGGVDGQGATAAAGSWPGWYAAVIQLVGGTLVLLGLGTRAAAFIASGSMAYAYFKVHQPQALWPSQNGGEAAALYCWAMFLLLFTGSGGLGLDQLLTRRQRASEGRTSSGKAPVAA